jgi:hypothetical protein
MARRWPWRMKVDRSKCEFAFFLSHVSEDAEDVKQLAEAIAAEFEYRGGLLVPRLLDFYAQEMQKWQGQTKPP